jgi:acid phosphatase family membrane protein YuiD
MKKKQNKNVISQIFENEKKSNFMSINEVLQHNFNEVLEGSKLGQNETINSSNLVMNQRDRQNIKEFLSANHSQMGLNSG